MTSEPPLDWWGRCSVNSWRTLLQHDSAVKGNRCIILLLWCSYNKQLAFFLYHCHLLLLPLMGICAIFLFGETAQGLIICVRLSKWFTQPAANIQTCMCAVRSTIVCVSECMSVEKEENLALADAFIQNIFTSHGHDCNFKPLRESSCGASTRGEITGRGEHMYRRSILSALTAHCSYRVYVSVCVVFAEMGENKTVANIKKSRAYCCECFMHRT